jgi:hypothetical protein
VAATPDLTATGAVGAGSATLSHSMFLIKVDVAVGVGADDKINEGVAGGGCRGVEVEAVAWATAIVEIGAIELLSRSARHGSTHHSARLILAGSARHGAALGRIRRLTSLCRAREGQGRDETSRERET